MTTDAMDTFRAEADALVESLEAALLKLKDAPDDRDLIDAVFRDLHTLKGSGAMFGRQDIASFIHSFETAFEDVRAGHVAVDDVLVNISLAARDHVAALLADPSAGEGRAILADLSEHLSRALVGAAPDWRLQFYLPSDTLALGGRPEIVLDELRALGAWEVTAHLDRLPPLAAMDPTQFYLGWSARLPGDTPEDAIRDVFLFHDTGLDLTLARSDEGEAFVAPALPGVDAVSEADKPAAAPSSLMRVPSERLDDLMDRVGELVIAESRLVELAARIGDPGLVSVAEDIQRLATAMRDTTMSVRMTPIGAISGRFRRLVHDLSDTLGKPIDFVTEGEETELDKTVVDRLTEPLLHIIRNAADHGLEPAETRLAAGKSPAGTVRLAASYSGAEVLIVIEDDGRGLDGPAIRARAVERGLLSEGADLTDDEVFALIFEPGFSTASEVTELSGRGVGMDVVRRTIEDLRGVIEVSSEPGHGTRVTLRLPLTLAIIDGLLVEVANERFVIPLAAVDEIVELPAEHATDESGNAFLDIRDTLVPFLRLRRLLSSTGEPDPHQKVIVVTSGDGRIGLVVDRIIGTNQTVIKQLSPLHAGLKTFSGATILGDGAVALILDVPQLVSKGQSVTEQGRHAA